MAQHQLTHGTTDAWHKPTDACHKPTEHLSRKPDISQITPATHNSSSHLQRACPTIDPPWHEPAAQQHRWRGYCVRCCDCRCSPHCERSGYHHCCSSCRGHLYPRCSSLVGHARGLFLVNLVHACGVGGGVEQMHAREGAPLFLCVGVRAQAQVCAGCCWSCCEC